jgi:hypothetical protein
MQQPYFILLLLGLRVVHSGLWVHVVWHLVHVLQYPVFWLGLREHAKPMHVAQLQLQQLLLVRCGKRMRVVRKLLLLLDHAMLWLGLC